MKNVDFIKPNYKDQSKSFVKDTTAYDKIYRDSIEDDNCC